MRATVLEIDKIAIYFMSFLRCGGEFSSGSEFFEKA